MVSLTGIGALGTIHVDNTVARIGAGAKLAAIAEHPRLKELSSALTTAAGEVGGPQIRNMGTLGRQPVPAQSLLVFPRRAHALPFKGGQRCFALDGENKYHALFAQGHRCVIVNPSTLAPALIAVGAGVNILGPKGKRTTELAKFFKAPSSAADREHTLEPNEMILDVTIPVRTLASASYEVRHKQAYDWPLVQAAVAFAGGRNGAKATGVKIVLGHVAPTPHIAEAAARALEGREITEASATAAGRAAAEGAKPLTQTPYKIKLVEVAVKRALLSAAGLKRYWETT